MVSSNDQNLLISTTCGFCLFSALQKISNRSILARYGLVFCCDPSKSVTTQPCWVVCSLLFGRSQNLTLLDAARRMFPSIKREPKLGHACFSFALLTSNHSIIPSNDQNSLRAVTWVRVFSGFKRSQIRRFWIWLYFLPQALKMQGPLTHVRLFVLCPPSKIRLFHMMEA
jgi:hypothetical protein